jgi:hypothetical protein
MLNAIFVIATFTIVIILSINQLVLAQTNNSIEKEVLLPQFNGSQPIYDKNQYKTFESTEFSFKMNYSVDWVVIKDDNYFSPGTYKLGTIVVPSGFAQVAQLCPSFEVGPNPEVLDCQKNSVAYININMFKLSKGTSLQKFMKSEISKIKTLGPREILESYQTKLSGLPAYRIVHTLKTDETLSPIDPRRFSPIIANVYSVGNDIGYQLFFHAEHEDYIRYLPRFQQLLDSFEILGLQVDGTSAMD